MTEKKTVLEFVNVSKSFAKVEDDTVVQAIRNINLTMTDGEFVSIVGPSGCGKSTILNLITGFYPPTEGRVLVNGKEIKEPGPDRGLVFQKPTLFPWLTVEENIAFSLNVRGTRQKNDQRVERMLEIIGLKDFRDDYPAQLSGGMAQRVALVRSLISAPEILLMDEPLGALDAFTRMNMQQEILEMWEKEKRLVVMVTHDVDEAIYMSKRVIIMNANPGRIVRDLSIDLEYPRERASDKFIEYRKQILNDLHLGGSESDENTI